MKLPHADNIQTHENAVEVSILALKQRLQREQILNKITPSSEHENNIHTLEKTIAYLQDYLIADGYPQVDVKEITTEWRPERKPTPSPIKL